MLKNIHGWNVSRLPHKSWSWSLTSLIGTWCHTPGCFLQKRLMLASCCSLKQVSLSFSSSLSPTRNQSLQNLKCLHFSIPLCTPVQGLDFDFQQKSAPQGSGGGQTECFMSCPWYMWCSGKSHRLQTISGDDCELFSLYPRLAWRGRGQTSACSCRGFLTLSEGMGGQRL